MTLICALDHCHSSHQETSSADSRLLTFTANLPARLATIAACSAAQRIGAGLRCQGHDLGEPPHRAKECPTAPEEVEETD